MRIRKVVKIVVLALVTLLVVSAIGGYFYFNNKFTPPPNYLTVSGPETKIPIKWVADKYSPMAALLLPVRLKGIPKTFYMQLDLGAHSTLLYLRSMASIQEQYPDVLTHQFDSTGTIADFSFSLDQMHIQAEKMKVINYGRSIDWDDSVALDIIGTIGADMLEKKLLVMNFRRNYCFFGDEMPSEFKGVSMADFEFEKRWVLLPATINGKSKKLLFDSGSSAFEFITDKNTWTQMAKASAEPVAHKVNSWGNTLETFNIESDQEIDFGVEKVNVKCVTYVEGSSFFQSALMRMTGMGGMISNRLFKNKILILDARREKFGITQ